MATRASDIYIPTADDVLTMSETGSTAYEIVMLSLSGVIVLITGIAVLTTILRKYWKKNRLLEEPSTIEVVVESYSHERNRCNGTSPPDPSGQPHSSCTCEAVGETCPKKHEHRDASLSHPVACFINDVHITIRQTFVPRVFLYRFGKVGSVELAVCAALLRFLVGRAGPASMAFTLYSLLQAALLCVNAVAVLHEERFLNKIGWGTDQSVGGFGEEPGIKSQLVNLIRSVRMVMRLPLIVLNSITIVLLLLFG